MASRAISNTGPILHLAEIELSPALKLFRIAIPEEVFSELKKNRVAIPKNVRVINLKPKSKDVSELLVNKFSLDLGESEAIALALQEKSNYFLTDDLDARTVAQAYNIEVHGTVGLVMRALREKVIPKKRAIEKAYELYTSSSLFITKDLIEEMIKATREYRM